LFQVKFKLLELENTHFVPEKIAQGLWDTLNKNAIESTENCRKTLGRLFPGASEEDVKEVLESNSLQATFVETELGSTHRRKKFVEKLEYYLKPSILEFHEIAKSTPKLAKVIL
jgi:hypothetical protein